MNNKQPQLTAKLVQCDDEVLADFKDFGPITITLNKIEDILFLHTASLVMTCNHKVENAEHILKLTAHTAASVGPEKAVDMSVDEGRKAGFYFPEFYKPLAIAMLKHSMSKARNDEGKDSVD